MTKNKLEEVFNKIVVGKVMHPQLKNNDGSPNYAFDETVNPYKLAEVLVEMEGRLGKLEYPMYVADKNSIKLATYEEGFQAAIKEVREWGKEHGRESGILIRLEDIYVLLDHLEKKCG